MPMPMPQDSACWVGLAFLIEIWLQLGTVLEPCHMGYCKFHFSMKSSLILCTVFNEHKTTLTSLGFLILEVLYAVEDVHSKVLCFQQTALNAA